MTNIMSNKIISFDKFNIQFTNVVIKAAGFPS